MLEATTRIYVRHPDQSDDLVPAVVQETLNNKVMVRFLQPVSFPPGAQTTVLFHNASNCFTSAPCQMQRMFSKGQFPTGALVLTGEAAVAESRSAFRIDVHDQSVSATVNGKFSGEIVNISCGGIGLLLDVEDYMPDQWLDVTLAYGCDEFPGRMQVRSKFRDKDGRFRYGLMADPEGTDLLSQLTRITQEIQNLKARRTSRIGVNNKASGSSEDSSTNTNAPSEENDDSQADSGEDESLCSDGTKRRHQRNAWPGMAKVYIREDHNLRVLSVDTQDLSRGGISFTSPKYIYEGSEAMFEKPIEGGFFRVMIKVRNVRVQNGGQHRIGAQFTGAPMQGGKIPEEYDASRAA